MKLDKGKVVRDLMRLGLEPKLAVKVARIVLEQEREDAQLRADARRIAG